MRRLTLFAAGAAASCLFAFYNSLHAAFILGALSLCALLFACCFIKREKAPRFLAAGLLFGVAISLLYTALAFWPAERLAGQTIRLEAEVTGFPTEGMYGVTVPVRGNEAGEPPLAISLRLDDKYDTLRPGDRLSCVVYCASTLGGGGLLEQTPRARGVFLGAKAYGGVAVAPAEGISWRYAPALAARALDDLLARLYPSDRASFLAALITGNTENMSAADKAAFARTGVSHVVSVSGMHVSFLAGMLCLAFGREKKSSAVLQIVIIFFFAAMAGNSPGALRAAVFWTVGLLAPFFRRRSDALTSLCAALLFLLILRPYSIADVSLQLSFAATLGILLLAVPLQAHWLARLSKKKRRYFAGILSLAAVSLGVNVFTLPLSALYFGEVSLISPFTNLLSNWAVALAFLGGVLSLALGALFLPLGMLAASVTDLPVRFFLWTARSGSRLSFASLPTEASYYKLFFLFLYAMLLLYLFWWTRGERRPVLPISALLLGLCFSIVLTSWSLKSHRLDFTLLDVGQGQSIALVSDGRRALIDCGGSRPAAVVAASYFHRFGYSGLDLLVVTHYDADHVNGVSELLQKMKIGVLALPDAAPEHPFRREMEALALAAGSELWYIESETLVEFGNCTLTLYPPLGDSQDNESGLSLLCAAGEWSALITGDMGPETEGRLLGQYDLPDIDLFVAGHHGSKNASSEALLDALSPETVLISVGAYNTYGHPAEETLLRFAEREIGVYRSDQLGSITVSLNKP